MVGESGRRCGVKRVVNFVHLEDDFPWFHAVKPTPEGPYSTGPIVIIRAAITSRAKSSFSALACLRSRSSRFQDSSSCPLQPLFPSYQDASLFTGSKLLSTAYGFDRHSRSALQVRSATRVAREPTHFFEKRVIRSLRQPQRLKRRPSAKRGLRTSKPPPGLCGAARRKVADDPADRLPLPILLWNPAEQRQSLLRVHPHSLSRSFERCDPLTREGPASNGAGRVPVGEPEPPELVVWHESLDQRKELSLLKPDVCVTQFPRRMQRLPIDDASRHGDVEFASEPLELHVLDACLAQGSRLRLGMPDEKREELFFLTRPVKAG
jgi:hypothetical protein